MSDKLSRAFLESVVTDAVSAYIIYLTQEDVMIGNPSVVCNDLSRFISDDIIKNIPDLLKHIGEAHG